MSKRRSRRPRSQRKPHRETHRFTKRKSLIVERSIPRSDFTDAMDHRRYNPEKQRAKIINFKAQQMAVSPDSKNRVKKLTVNPVRELRPFEKDIICKRRSIRKEVMFANRKAGKGGNQKRKLTYKSKIKC